MKNTIKLLFSLGLLSGCIADYDHCRTINPGLHYTKINITDGSSHGHYYCKRVYADHATDCVLIYTNESKAGTTCNANDIVYKNILFGGAVVEIE